MYSIFSAAGIWDQMCTDCGVFIVGRAHDTVLRENKDLHLHISPCPLHTFSICYLKVLMTILRPGKAFKSSTVSYLYSYIPVSVKVYTSATELLLRADIPY